MARDPLEGIFGTEPANGVSGYGDGDIYANGDITSSELDSTELSQSAGPKKEFKFTGMQKVNNGELFIKGAGDQLEINPNDIEQGQLGDCFFVSSLAVVAHQNPDAIKNAVKYNPTDNNYTVTFYEDKSFLGLFGSAEKVEITVDAEFPLANRIVDGVDKGAVVPHVKGGDVLSGKEEIWPRIFEKAYATWQGEGDALKGYSLLDNGGKAKNALFALTGQRGEYKSADSFGLDDISARQSGGYAVSISSLPKGEGANLPLYKNGSLVNGHQYYITDVNVKTGDVTIQNPWQWDKHKLVLPYNDIKDNFNYITTNPITPRKK